MNESRRFLKLPEWYTYFLVFVVAVFFIAERAVSADVLEVIKSRTKSFVQEIRSIEFEAVAEWEAVCGVTNRTEKFREQMRYFQSDNMSMAITNAVYSGLFDYENFSGDWVIIYNGERFQIFQSEGGTMEWREWSGDWTNTIPSRSMSPVTQVFSWLAKRGRPHAWSNITSDENIDDIFKQVEHIGNRTLNDIECVVLEFRGTHSRAPGLMKEVWFSQGNDYFPVKIVLHLDGSPITNVEVKGIREVILDNGTKIFIPVEIVSVSTHPRSEYTSSIDTIMMDTSTLKINHEIDDALFMQPQHSIIAKHMPRTGQLETVERRYVSHYIIVVITIICVVFIGLVVCYLLWNRRKIGKSCDIQ